jgi:predicted regulator of Ras-like GTPase activity (Roadblock/LC7/MglB family)
VPNHSGDSSQSIHDQLKEINQRSGFTATVLTDDDGLPLATASQTEGDLAEMLAAVAPLVQRMVQRSNERAGLSEANEVVINNADRSRLICRFFVARQQMLILACLVPEGVPYRRAMNLTVSTVQKIWMD